MKRLLYMLVLGVAALACMAPAASSWGKYQHLDDVASWLAQRPVHVRCQTAYESSRDPMIAVWGASAYVLIKKDPGSGRWLEPEDFTVFAHGICEDLVEHQAGDPLTPDYVWALLVIVHESGHLRGGPFPLWYDEGLVNCWALRRVAAVAQLKFGLPPEQVPELKGIAWKLFLAQPDAYNISGCTLK